MGELLCPFYGPEYVGDIRIQHPGLRNMQTGVCGAENSPARAKACCDNAVKTLLHIGLETVVIKGLMEIEPIPTNDEGDEVTPISHHQAQGVLSALGGFHIEDPRIKPQKS